MEKDLIVGCISNYTPKDIKNWVKSIEQSGFTGDKIMLTFGIPDETVKYLIDNGFQIYSLELNGRHIVVERFYGLWQLLSTLNENDYEHVITTDVKDVIFQYDPSFWLRSNLWQDNKKIIVSSECIKYKDEDWGDNNLKVSYPHLYEENKNNTIYNAGTIAGEFKYMKDFFLHIFNLALLGQDRQPDQAAMNILIHTYPFKDIVKLVDQNEGWCCQLGTTLDPKVKDKYKDKLLEEIPLYSGTGLVYHDKHKGFYLVHQYDRVPELNDLINERYK